MICLRSHSSAERAGTHPQVSGILLNCVHGILGFPSGIVVINQPINARVERPWDSIPRSKRSTGVGNGKPLQYSCLENPMGSEAWLATPHGAKMELSVGKLRAECKNHLKLYMCVYYTHIHIYIYTHIYVYTYIYIYYICIQCVCIHTFVCGKSLELLLDSLRFLQRPK